MFLIQVRLWLKTLHLHSYVFKMAAAAMAGIQLIYHAYSVEDQAYMASQYQIIRGLPLFASAKAPTVVDIIEVSILPISIGLD